MQFLPAQGSCTQGFPSLLSWAAPKWSKTTGALQVPWVREAQDASWWRREGAGGQPQSPREMLSGAGSKPCPLCASAVPGQRCSSRRSSACSTCSNTGECTVRVSKILYVDRALKDCLLDIMLLQLLAQPSPPWSPPSSPMVLTILTDGPHHLPHGPHHLPCGPHHLSGGICLCLVSDDTSSLHDITSAECRCWGSGGCITVWKDVNNSNETACLRSHTY